MQKRGKIVLAHFWQLMKDSFQLKHFVMNNDFDRIVQEELIPNQMYLPVYFAFD